MRRRHRQHPAETQMPAAAGQWWSRNRYWVVWFTTSVFGVLDLVFTVALVRIKVHNGEPLITAGQAVIIGIQTLATILLAGLTASYVFATNDLLNETVIERTRREAQEQSEEVAKLCADLDETRRLAYVALLAGTTPHVELAATLVNALAHHQHADLDEALGNVPTVLNGGNGDYPAAEWLKSQIEQINAKLAALWTEASGKIAKAD